MTLNFHSSCKHMHLYFKSICIKEHKGVICNMTSLSNSSHSTRPTGRVEFLSPGICMQGNFYALLLSVDYFVKTNFFKKIFNKQYGCQSV